MNGNGTIRRIAALAAAVAVNASFGALYAWSVFVPALELELSVSRTEISAVFSLAIAAFMTGNLTSAALFGRIPAPFLPLISGVLAAIGLNMGASGDYLHLLIGFGLMFGFAAGLAYNATLQLAQAALISRPGLANGLVISGFALGGTIAAAVLAPNIETMGALPTLALLGTTVALIVAAASLVLFFAGSRLERVTWTGMPKEDRRILGISWLGFLLGTFSGLIAIGHAAPIILHFGGTAAGAILGVTLIGLSNALGRFCAGALSDIIGVRSTAGLAHLIGAGGFMFVLASPDATGAMLTVVIEGFAYGMASSAYPSALAILLPRNTHGRNFALLLTAWGIAGLTGPYLGGYFYDFSGDYRIALEFGCVASMFALINAMRLPRKVT